MELKNLTDEEFETIMDALKFWGHPVPERKAKAVKLSAKLVLMQYTKESTSPVAIFCMN